MHKDITSVTEKYFESLELLAKCQAGDLNKIEAITAVYKFITLSDSKTIYSKTLMHKAWKQRGQLYKKSLC